jgi:type I restriction enzyme, S subunit
MTAVWERTTIGNVCQIVNGGTPKTGVESFWGGGHCWITPAEMGDLRSPYVSETRRTLSDGGMANSSARLLPPNSVILSSRAPIGHLVINTVPMATNQGCKGLVPSDRIDAQFLYYYLRSIVDLLNELGTGTTFKELSGGKLSRVPIGIPSVAEQKRIVSILDQAFDAIDTARANAETNVLKSENLFESYLNNVVADAQREGKPVALAELATDISDGDHQPPPKAKAGVPFITIGNIDKESHTLNLTETFLVPQSYYDDLKEKRKPRLGDVLYTVTGSFGIPVRVETKQPFCFQRHIALVRPKEDVDSEWLYYLLRSPQVFRQADAGATGTAQRTVSLKLLRCLQVPRLSITSQRQASKLLGEFMRQSQRLVSIYKSKVGILDTLRGSLLASAFSGSL